MFDSKKISIDARVLEAFETLANPDKIAHYQRYFKTAKGEYGEGTIFMGIAVPDQRQIAKHFYQLLTLDDLTQLIQSPIHEHRLTALFILVLQYEKTKEKSIQKQCYTFYKKHLKFINNWDLVDCSSYKIIGHYAYHNHQENYLTQLGQKNHLWSQRIAVISSLYFIKKHQFELPLQLITQNLYTTQDLIQKANGWMLREIGNRNKEYLCTYLETYYQKMPRTTLRYAIERLNAVEKVYFMKK